MNENDKAICPVCKTEFNIAKEYEVGDIINCPKCKIKLEIGSLFPPEVLEVEYEDSELEEVEEILSEAEEASEELEEAGEIEKNRKESDDDYRENDI